MGIKGPIFAHKYCKTQYLYIQTHYTCSTMGMKLIQLRLPEALIKDIDKIVKKGYYPTKSGLIRDAVRRLLQRRPRLIDDATQQAGKLPHIKKHGIGEFDYIH